jgi:hypothetical protein
MKRIKLEKSTVELLDSGIMYIHIKPGCDIELADAVLIVEAMGKIGHKKKYPVLIDAGEFSSIDKETRVFSASIESNIYTLADAIAYCNLAQKLMAEFYLKHNKPVIPTAIFSEREEAISWLIGFRDKPAKTAANHAGLH